MIQSSSSALASVGLGDPSGSMSDKVNEKGVRTFCPGEMTPLGSLTIVEFFMAAKTGKKYLLRRKQSSTARELQVPWVCAVKAAVPTWWAEPRKAKLAILECGCAGAEENPSEATVEGIKVYQEAGRSVGENMAAREGRNPRDTLSMNLLVVYFMCPCAMPSRCQMIVPLPVRG